MLSLCPSVRAYVPQTQMVRTYACAKIFPDRLSVDFQFYFRLQRREKQLITSSSSVLAAASHNVRSKPGSVLQCTRIIMLPLKRYRDPSVCLSHGAAAQPPEMCGLRTRPRTDVDPPRFLPPSNCHRRRGGISSRRPRADTLYCITHVVHSRI